MRIRRSQIYLGIFVTLLIGLFSILSDSTEARASTVPDVSDVLKAAPVGMDLSDYFEYPSSYTYDTSKTIANSAQVITKGSTSPTDLIEMTNGSSQLGSVWGKMTDANGKDYNYFDVTKNQTFSMWMYFSGKEGTSGDGMAFVIQNDARGANAISTYATSSSSLFGGTIRKPIGGETLGVWGGDGSGTDIVSTNTAIASGAIKNSIAVEFDSFMNTTAADGLLLSGSKTDSYFDAAKDSSNTLQVKGPHIAWNYPGEANTYIPNIGTIWMYYGMNHNNPIPNTYLAGSDDITNTTQNAWHHVTIKYTAPDSGSTTAHLQYIFDDKDYDGTVKPYSQWDQRGDGADSGTHKIIDLDLGKLGLAAGQTKVRWGITSSSESTATTNAVIFESIPAVADISATTNLYDSTQERDIPDGDRYPDEDHNVNNGDSLRFDYNLIYNSGLAETGDITTKINVPKNVDFTADSDGNIGEIEYSGTTQKIKATDLNSDGTINLTLNSMSSTNSIAKVHLYGKADIGDNTTAKATTVDQAHTSYDSSHYTGDVMSPKFTINPVNDTLKIKNSDDLTKTAKLGSSVSMAGTISYDKGSTFGSNSLTVHTLVDGVQQADSTLSVDSTATTADYALKYDADTLGVGKHTVEVYVSDAMHLMSNHITYNVTVEDKKLMLTSNNQTSYTISPEDSITFSGTMSYDDNSEYDPGSAKVAYQVDDKTPLYDMPKTSSSGDITSYDSSDVITGSSLGVGKHTLVIYAEDLDGRKSAVYTITINVTTKVLSLESNKSYSFQTTNQSAESKLIQRTGNWDLKVTSAKTAWSLTAQSTALMNSSTGLPITGEMVYRTNTNEYSLEDNPVLIDSDSTVSDDTVTTDVTSDWTKNTGILLNVQPDTSAGTYTGQIDWTLTDSIDTN
ncbi:L-type lectin family protein [Companilactobacillus jidongensis]|uniref:lectin-like domain-containing protein n=1 Tax=Companilactobacillus jidongensis TaxID=2486006 RepID=UPI000F7B0344|nr:hypothetical protein [Companilactobacillus jidongensis]